MLSLALAQRLIVEEQIRVSENTVEWCPDLMANGRQELALGLARLLCKPLRRFELLCLAVPLGDVAHMRHDLLRGPSLVTNELVIRFDPYPGPVLPSEPMRAGDAVRLTAHQSRPLRFDEA